MPLLDILFGQRSFFITNLDTGQELQGQFPALNPVENVGSRYGSGTNLGRSNPFRQFIGGEIDTITFQAMFFNKSDFLGSAEDDLELIKSWVRTDSKLNRPPIVSFSVGDGHLSMGSCTIDRVQATHLQPSFLGKLQGVTCSITLSRFVSYTLDQPEPGETRYHRAKENDYFEMLTWLEYKSAEMGDIIRKRHPNKLNIQINEIIKLPSIEAIRSERIEQKSETFKTAYGKKETPQRTLRLLRLKERSGDYVSHLL